MLKTQIRIYLGHANYKVTLGDAVMWKFREDSDTNVDRIELSRIIDSHEDFVNAIETAEKLYDGDDIRDIITETVEF